MRKNIVNIVILIIAGIVFVSAWCSFFPGNFNIDAAGGVWAEIKGRTFSNMYPALNQIIGYWLTRVWNSPGVIILFQIILSLFCLYELLSLFDRLKVKQWWKLLIVVFFVLSPKIIIYNFSCLKDVNFGYFLFLTSILLVNIFIDKKIKKTSTTIILVVLTVLVSIIRHNGLPLLGIVPISLLLVLGVNYKNIKITAIVLIGSIVLYFLITSGLYKVYNVYQYPSYYPWMTRIHEVAAVISQKGLITDEEIVYLDEILPIKYWNEYYFCYARERLVHSGDGWPEQPYIDYQIIESDYQKFKKLTSNIVLRNTSLVLSQKTCLFTGMLGLSDGLNGDYLYPLMSESELTQQPGFNKFGYPELEKRTVFISSEKTKIFWINYFNFWVEKFKIMWAIPFFSFLVMLSWLTIPWFGNGKLRRKMYLLILSILLPSLVMLGTFLVFGTNSDLHFLFFLYPQILLTPIIINLCKK